MLANEKMISIVNRGENFYENFCTEVDQRFDKCFEWLGFGITKTGRVAIEANVLHSPVRFQFLFSLRSGVDAMCLMNIRVRTDLFDGARSQADEVSYFNLLRSPQVFGPNANIKNPQNDAYFKPFGYLPRGVTQSDVFFDARTPNANPQTVHACSVALNGEALTLIEAIRRVLSHLGLCGCTNTEKVVGSGYDEQAVMPEIIAGMVDFDEFTKQAKDLGYRPIQQADRAELLYIRTKNRVKVEINTKQGTCIAGYGLTSEQLDQLANSLFSPSNEIKFTRVHQSRKLIYIKYGGMPLYWSFVNAIESIHLKLNTLAECNAPIVESQLALADSSANVTQVQMIDFAEFSRQARAHQYEPKQQSDRSELLFVKTRNKVKVEINTKSRSYIAGYGLSEEEMSALKTCLLDAQEQGEIKLKFLNRTLAYAEYEGLDKFWWLVNLIENISGIVARSRGFAYRPFKDVANNDIFLKIAKTYKFAIEIEHQNLLDTVRVLLEADKIDDLIVKGCSINHREENSYREHVVPCVMIHNEVIRTFLNEGLGDEVVEKVASLIEKNLVIIKITDEERVMLDVTLGLRTTMPTGWTFGDDIYARLAEGNIEIDCFDQEEDDSDAGVDLH
jgi:hypothetical protein